MKGNKYLVTTITVSALLGGCGGGGGGKGGGGGSAAEGSASPATANAAQGTYQGTASNGSTHDIIVLDNGQYYSIYGYALAGRSIVAGLLQGTGQANNGTFTSTDLKDFDYNARVRPGSLSASYKPGVSFNGSVTGGSRSTTFTGAVHDSSLFNYNTPAKPADIAGDWNTSSLTGSRYALNIAAGGLLTGTGASGCSIKGTATPRGSKNVFDVALTFGGAPCPMPNQSTTGIAISYVVSSGKRQLILAGVDGPRNNALVLFGDR
jgi:hypothetical protein